MTLGRCPLSIFCSRGTLPEPSSLHPQISPLRLRVASATLSLSLNVFPARNASVGADKIVYTREVISSTGNEVPWFAVMFTQLYFLVAQAFFLVNLDCSSATSPAGRCRANMAHTRQSRPYSGLNFKVNVLKTVQAIPFSLGSGREENSSFIVSSSLLLLHSRYRS